MHLTVLLNCIFNKHASSSDFVLFCSKLLCHVSVMWMSGVIVYGSASSVCLSTIFSSHCNAHKVNTNFIFPYISFAGTFSTGWKLCFQIFNCFVSTKLFWISKQWNDYFYWNDSITFFLCTVHIWPIELVSSAQ